MAVAIDASTPTPTAQTVNTVATLASNSFTPPALSVLLACWGSDSQTSTAPSAPTITDSLGAHLTWTLIGHRNFGDSGGKNGQAAMWIAIALSAPGAMTITVTNGAASGFRRSRLVPLVLSGANTTAPNAQSNEGSDSAGALDTPTYTSAVLNSMGFLIATDWDVNSSTFTAATGTTLVDGAVVVTSVNVMVLRQTTPGAAGSTVNLRATAPAASTQWNYVWVEIAPAVAAAANTGLLNPMHYHEDRDEDSGLYRLRSKLWTPRQQRPTHRELLAA